MIKSDVERGFVVSLLSDARDYFYLKLSALFPKRLILFCTIRGLVRMIERREEEEKKIGNRSGAKSRKAVLKK